MKYKVVVFAFLISFMGCAQPKTKTKKENMNREETNNKMDSLELSFTDQIQEYDKRPYYTIQVNKQNCRVLVRVNDLPLWHEFFEEGGESVLLPINDLIPLSGEQTLSIEVYPLSVEQTISDKAHINMKVIYASDRHIPMDEYEVIAEYNLPEEGLADKKLPLYVVKGAFSAEVPFNFSKELESAKDLAKVPAIEKKILQKYKQLNQLMEKADGYNFLLEKKKSLLRNWSYNYFTKEEIEAHPESEDEVYDLSLMGREIGLIENYEIVFYHNNRVVVLRDKDDKSSLLKVYYCDNEVYDENGKYTDEETGEVYDCNKRENKSVNDKFVTLYMPKGSDELKVW